ncbi:MULTISPECIES: glycosyltransferase [unclassified Lentimicrobium]|uniref:glycosyltransferase n=1 Tax=unclassified Lentimicrobium TaxID=2677434 RepID=UPI00155721B4|nr:MULTISPECIES: glycosyltransferase [unclassified Lentimicrobium]NPD44838.1 glycosyltransferase [Lentimicrobium sp. S6]NPD83145.1 glycosyltransferase [Lentimicrobium sp. L6]
MIIVILSWLIVLLYIFVILRFYWAWTKIQDNNPKSSSLKKISIVIATRNEEENLAPLFQSILDLDYPRNHFEVILINDHSDDSSLNLMERFKKSNTEIDITLNTLSSHETGKKMALRKAFSLAKYDIIQCTDGDCEFSRLWLQECTKAFENPAIKLISGGIRINHSPSIFQKMQALELLSLIASGGAAIGLQRPIMCNGANMAFRKEILLQEKEDLMNHKYESGDDIFLLQEVKRRFGPSAITFIKDQNYWITTTAEENVSGWLNQRMRWVSKSAGYKDSFLIFTSTLVFLANLSLVILAIGSIFKIQLPSTFVYLFILKGFVDFIFLKKATSDSSQKHLLWVFIPLNLFYPFFISYSAIFGQFKGFTWKGRIYKK